MIEQSTQDNGASVPERAVVNGAASVSAVPASIPSAALSTWAERRPNRTESERAAIATQYADHLPAIPTGLFYSDADLDAMRAAFIRRFDEDLPRTETLMAVATIGYRLALRDAKAIEARSDKTGTGLAVGESAGRQALPETTPKDTLHDTQ